MAVLELLDSPPGTGKTRACIELFRNEILKSKAGIDSRSFFVLPSREHAERIQNLVLKDDVAGLFNVHILTINDLTARLLGVSNRLHPDDGLRAWLVRSILKQGRWTYFRKIQDQEGAVRLFTGVLKEFQSSLLSIGEFEKRARPLLRNPAFGLKFRDFKLFWKSYEARLRELALSEPEQDIVKLLKGQKPAFKADLVIFDGFYHFSRAQRQLVAYLARQCRHMVVTLSLPGEPQRRGDLFHYPAETRAFLLKQGFKTRQPTPLKNWRTADAALVYLEQNIFLPKPSPYPHPAPAVTIFETDSRRLELEMIAREIRKLHAQSDSLHWGDIAVVFRSIGGEEARLRSVFAALQIPVHIHERLKVIDHGWAMTWSRFFNLTREDWRREDVFFVLKSSFWGACLPDALAIEALAVRENVLGSRAAWQKLALKADLEEGPRQLLGDLLDLEQRFLNTSTLGEFRTLFQGRIGHFKKDTLDEPLLRTIEEVWVERRFEEGFQPAVFIARFQDWLQVALYSVRPDRINCVQIYDAVLALPKEYKVVFLAGLLEREFPKETAEDALFKDEERHVINRGGVVLEERRWRKAGERYFFYMMLTRVKERLYLSYPLYDAEGHPVLRSFFVEELEKCFPAVERRRRALSFFLPESRPSGVAPQALIRDEKIRGIFSSFQGPFSPTRLETYSTCAFKYFCERILFLQDPFASNEARIMGTIQHAVLEDFYKNKPKDSANARAWVRERLSDHFEKSAFRNEPLYRRKIYFTQILETLCRFLESEEKNPSRENFEPRFFEYAFRDLAISGTVMLEGKIDRVDVSRDGTQALVIDYKRSKRSESVKSRLGRGLELQLPVYTMAAQKLLGLQVAGAELRFLKDGGSEGIYREASRELLGLAPRKKAHSEDDFQTIGESARREIHALVSRLKNADISVRSKSCDYCSFAAVCRFEPWKLLYAFEDSKTGD